MSYILHIETAVDICSVAISQNGKLVAFQEERSTKSHANLTHKFIQAVIEKVGLHLSDLSAVSVSSGPGSYTGLRIGVSAAKGLCYGLDIPLIALGTLDSMAYGMRQFAKNLTDNTVFLPMIDAGRMDVYTCQFDSSLQPMNSITAISCDNDFFNQYDSSLIVYLGGNGAVKFQEMLTGRQNFVFIKENVHSSLHSIYLTYQKFQKQEFADVAYFEPFYLKDYIPGKPRVKGL